MQSITSNISKAPNKVCHTSLLRKVRGYLTSESVFELFQCFFLIKYRNYNSDPLDKTDVAADLGNALQCVIKWSKSSKTKLLYFNLLRDPLLPFIIMMLTSRKITYYVSSD